MPPTGGRPAPLELPQADDMLVAALRAQGEPGVRALGLLQDARRALTGTELARPAEVAAACVRSAADTLLKLPGAPESVGLQAAAQDLLDAVDALRPPATGAADNSSAPPGPAEVGPAPPRCRTTPLTPVTDDGLDFGLPPTVIDTLYTAPQLDYRHYAVLPAAGEGRKHVAPATKRSQTFAGPSTRSPARPGPHPRQRTAAGRARPAGHRHGISRAHHPEYRAYGACLICHHEPSAPAENGRWSSCSGP